MSNHTGTLLRVIGVFFSLLGFWFMVSFILICLISLVENSFFSFTNILYGFMIILIIRVFYPRFVFRS
jgi:hypothetical protein